ARQCRPCARAGACLGRCERGAAFPSRGLPHAAQDLRHPGRQGPGPEPDVQPGSPRFLLRSGAARLPAGAGRMGAHGGHPLRPRGGGRGDTGSGPGGGAPPRRTEGQDAL
ncbi:MAG: hypothetical protein AVDCRST_MAG27-188, partial [uncultured Craurococcus sp.]